MLARAINMCCVFFLPFLPCYARLCHLHSFPTRRSSDLLAISMASGAVGDFVACALLVVDQVVGFFVTEVFGFLYVAAVYFVQVDAEGWGAADGHYGHAGVGGAV